MKLDEETQVHLLLERFRIALSHEAVDHLPSTVGRTGMRKRSRKSPQSDVNETAYSVVAQATGQAPKIVPEDTRKNPAAVALGRLGGLKGGKARAEALSPRQRAASARKAAEARWGTTKGRRHGSG